MLGAFRRCAASVPRTICSVSSAAKSSPSITSISSSPTRFAVARPIISTRSFQNVARWQQQTAARAEIEAEIEDEVNAQHPPSDVEIDSEAAKGPIANFSELPRKGLVHSNVIKAITNMGIDTMTEVQTATINQALRGTDIIGQAKTGTGKTLAFLVPILASIIKADPSLAEKYRGRYRSSPGDIRAIIISPTRELAEQIAVEARKLTAYTNVIVQTAVGGTQKREALRKLQYEGCHILVGTPGRLNDVLSDPTSGVSAPKLTCLVLDEADRLLDTGFLSEIENIEMSLPDPDKVPRQTMLFSATIPKEVISLVRKMLQPDFSYVKCVRDDEVPTHERVPQRVVHTHGMENTLPALVELCQKGLEEAKTDGKPFKAIVYYNSTAEVSLVSEALRNLGGGSRFNRMGSGSDHPLAPARIFEMQSKLTQMQRQRASDSFRRAESAILISSDVTARGMDFPNVTHVIQVGVPRTHDTYIHRIGRTGRAGKEGQGWLIVPSLEKSLFYKNLSDLPVEEDKSLHSARLDMTREAELPPNVAQLLNKIGDALKRIDREYMMKAYLGYLGVYGWADKRRLVESINRLAVHGWGMEEPPRVPVALASKLGLTHVPGINLQEDSGRFGGRSRLEDKRSQGRWERPERSFGGRSGGGRQARRDPFAQLEEESMRSRGNRF